MGVRSSAGRLRERVQFRRKVRSPLGGGNFAETWENVGTAVWASVEPLRGSERLQAAQIEARRDYRVVVRARRDLDEGMAIVWRGKSLAIRFIGEAGSGEAFMAIDCEMGAMAEALPD